MGWIRELLGRYRWLPYALPMAVFLMFTSLEPKPPEPSADGVANAGMIPYAYYPAAYALKIALTVVAMVVVSPVYRSVPLGIHPASILIGAAGAAVWIALCHQELETRFLPAWLAGTGSRSAFNPFTQLDGPVQAWGFLAVRLFGMACVVPVIEEFFLRGLLTRYFVDEDWEKVPLGRATPAATAITIIVAMLMHPATEYLAALAWFSLVTYWYARTGNLWDAVAAHAVTNLLLGLYVIGSGAWQLL